MAVTSVSEIVVPEVFLPYVRALTEEKSRLIQSGAVVRDPTADEFLRGGGITYNIPGWNDLDNTAANVSTDTAGAATPLANATHTQIAVRLSRNQSWSKYHLAVALAGSDPFALVADRVAAYWAREAQRTFIATWQGVARDNGANDSEDMALDAVGVSYSAGTTDFTAENYIDARQTMGDSSTDVALVMMHSAVEAKARKADLITDIRDSEGRLVLSQYQGATVIVDDNMPSGTDVVRGDGTTSAVATAYETWIFGFGATHLGMGDPLGAPAIEFDSAPLAGNGGGQETVTHRVEWVLHPEGFAYTGTPANGGPGNGTNANDLNHAGSWDRVYPERKQIKMCRLITRES